MNQGDNFEVMVLPKSNGIAYAVDEFRARQEAQYSDLRYLEDARRDRYLLMGEERIVANGPDNNFPLNYKHLLDQVYIGHGIKRSLLNLLLSGGVGLYRNTKSGNTIVRDWQLLEAYPEIEDWLLSWNFFSEWLPEAATDLIYVENLTPTFTRNRGARLGISPKVAAIGLIHAEQSRLQYVDFGQTRTKIYKSDWSFGELKPAHIVTYPVFNQAIPFAHPHAASFLKMPTFGSFDYGRPTDIGATELLKLLAILPNFHRANLTERPFRWMVKVNTSLYTKVQSEKGWAPGSKEFLEWKRKFFESIDQFLYAAKGDKSQTRFATEFMYNAAGNIEEKVIIEKLEDDTKEMSETGLGLWDSATVAVVSANAIHPQLANIHLKNHALSGSNLQEAYDMHIRTATPTMRELLLAPVNTALRINWPALGLRVGFQDVPLSTKPTPHEAIQQK